MTIGLRTGSEIPSTGKAKDPAYYRLPPSIYGLCSRPALLYTPPRYRSALDAQTRNPH